MNQVAHENSLLAVSAATAKTNKQKLTRYELYFIMSSACLVGVIAFFIYFIAIGNLVGIISFAVTTLLTAVATTLIFVFVIPKWKQSKAIVTQFLEEGGELKKENALDKFCIGCVKIMFAFMAIMIICSIPVCITVCFNMTFVEAILYVGSCIAGYWGAGSAPGGFFSYVVGIGAMAAIFALLLALIRFINMFLK